MIVFLCRSSPSIDSISPSVFPLKYGLYTFFDIWHHMALSLVVDVIPLQAVALAVVLAVALAVALALELVPLGLQVPLQSVSSYGLGHNLGQ